MEIIADLQNKKFLFSKTELENAMYLDIYIGFSQGEEIYTKFDNLAFGYDIQSDSGLTILSEIEPKLGISYVESDQEFDFFKRLIGYFVPLKKYTIKVWARNGQDYFEGFQKFETPPPPEPPAIFDHSNQ
jgi:hypothetical protein